MERPCATFRTHRSAFDLHRYTLSAAGNGKPCAHAHTRRFRKPLRQPSAVVAGLRDPKHIPRRDLITPFRMGRAARKLHDVHRVAAGSAIGSACGKRFFAHPDAKPPCCARRDA